MKKLLTTVIVIASTLGLAACAGSVSESRADTKKYTEAAINSCNSMEGSRHVLESGMLTCTYKTGNGFISEVEAHVSVFPNLMEKSLTIY